MCRRLLLLFLLFAYVPSLYAGPKEDAAAQKRRGDKAMEEGSYEDALRAFEEAKRLAADASIELSLAGALLKLRRFEEAKSAYQTYLDSGKASKQNQKKIKDAINNIESTLKTSVSCESTPTGAKIFLNSRVDGYIGETPLTFNLPPGEHRLFFEKEGFQPTVERLSIAEGGRAALKATLGALPFSLRVESSPSAELFIDGVSRGVTPQTLEIATGRHELTLSLEGYEPIRESVEGSLGQKVVVSKTLAAKPSTLQLAFSPARAEVRIEGRSEVFRANASMELPPGEYTVTASALGYQEQTLTISVPVGERASASSALQPTEGLLLVKTSRDVSIKVAQKTLQANTLQALPPGRYAIQLESPGRLPYEGELELSLGEVITIEPSLVPVRRFTPKELGITAASSLGLSLVLGSVYLSKRAQSNDVDFTKAQDNIRRFSKTSGDLFLGGAIGVGIAYAIAKKQEKSTIKIQVQKELP